MSGTNLREEPEIGEPSAEKWVRYVSGGNFLKWYGNLDYKLKDAFDEMRQLRGSAIRNQDLWFREGVTYCKLSSKGFNARLLPQGFVFSSGGNCTFSETEAVTPYDMLGLLNSRLAQYMLNQINPTVNYQTGDVERIPVPLRWGDTLRKKSESAVNLARSLSRNRRDLKGFEPCHGSFFD